MHRSLLTPLLYRLTRMQAVKAQRRFYLKTVSCAETQREVLLDKLRWASKTEYGQHYAFSKIASLEDYRKAVPLVEYEDMRPYIERVVLGEQNILFPAEEELLMFAMTSGTTATPKYIPITRKYIQELKRGNFAWGSAVIFDHPEALGHKILHIVSPSRESETDNGVPCGAATGLVAESQRKIAHFKYATPRSVYGISDYGIKYYCILRLALQQKISLLIAANPSTLVTIGHCLERNAHSLLKDLSDGTLAVAVELEPEIRRSIMSRLKKRRKLASSLEHILHKNGRLIPSDVWPELRVIACWTGGTLTPYLRLVKRYWGEKPLRDPGLIASEGRMTIPLEDGAKGGVLDVESHFYEFVPYESDAKEANTLLAHELEEGKRYYIILTTSSGLYRYNISDIVLVEGFFGNTPILKFLNKGKHISSLTGEKITEHQVVEAFQFCMDKLCLPIQQFTVCPGWAMPPFYFLLLEAQDEAMFAGADGISICSDLCRQFDIKLKELNVEYKSKRDSKRLGPPRLKLIEKGSFKSNKLAHIKKRGGRLEQYKHTYLSPSLEYHEQFTMAAP